MQSLRPLNPTSGNNNMDAGSSVTKRLQNELMTLMMSGDSAISAFPEGDNLFNWSANITGVADTPYENQTYQLSLIFPDGYPIKQPTVRFRTPCFHPNVDQCSGDICLDILKENWSAVYNVRTILLSIQSLLGEPNNDSPLNAHAASLWDNKPEFFKLNQKKYEEDKAKLL